MSRADIRPTSLPDADTTLEQLRGADLRLPAGWDANPAMAKALLRDAWRRLQEAEQIIADQERKIRELEDLASTDVLTGLMNRRGLDTFFEQELSRIRRGHSPGALLVLIDLDRFKAINDTHGHQAGDACLKIVASHIMDSIRFTDAAARLGGDEFAILLTQTDLDKAADRVRSIRNTLNEVHFDWQGTDLSCGGSLGIASISGEDASFTSAYQKADAALYADKAQRKEKA